MAEVNDCVLKVDGNGEDTGLKIIVKGPEGDEQEVGTMSAKVVDGKITLEINLHRPISLHSIYAEGFVKIWGKVRNEQE